MESVIFFTTLSALLTTPYMSVIPSTRSSRIREHGNKCSRMKESQAWFTIKLDDRVYPVYRLVQPDESVIFIVEIEERKIKLFKGENDSWVGDAQQELIDRIGKAIEEA